MVANITAILVVMEQSEKLDTVGVICGVKPLTCRISNASELLSERVIKLAPSGSKVKLQRCREDKLSGGPTSPDPRYASRICLSGQSIKTTSISWARIPRDWRLLDLLV